MLLTLTGCPTGEAAPNRRQVWIVARQHPGESMAEWFMEGKIITGELFATFTS